MMILKQRALSHVRTYRIALYMDQTDIFTQQICKNRDRNNERNLYLCGNVFNYNY